MVAGKNSVCGRVWHGSMRCSPLGSLFIVGNGFDERTLDGTPPFAPAPPGALFDRSLPLTGAGALARLARMKVAIVGASGTGSIAVELFRNAGSRRLLNIDDDVCKDVNATRILHMRRTDLAERTPKVLVAQRAVRELGFDCQVDAVVGNVLDRKVLMLLRDADVIFGCVDAAFARLMLCKFAYQYLRPYVDVGSEIGGDAEGIVSLNARASYVAPGRWCLQCAGIINDRQLRYESKSYAERQREVELGYSDDLALSKPAVMDLNMRATTLGTMLLRHLLQPFLADAIPVTILENLVTMSIVGYPSAKNANLNCPVCQKNLHQGYGDCGPALGLDPESLKFLTGA
jgi:hypothetical protein